MNSTPSTSSLNKEDRKTVAAMVRMVLGIYMWAHESDPLEELRGNPFVSEIRALIHRHRLRPDVEENGTTGADTDNLERLRPLYE